MQPYLHWASIDKQAIQVLSSFGGGLWLAENDLRNATARACLAEREKGLLDRTDRFCEVLLSVDV